MTILDIKKKYCGNIDILDLEILIAFAIKKEREFVLAHPEYVLTKNYELRINNHVQRRLKNEPLAYILGEKEFYGLNFKVNRHTLIPRPETELMVEIVLEGILNIQYSILNIIDVGTGSGNIIISLAHNIEHGTPKSSVSGQNMRQKESKNYNLQTTNYFATDISKEALKIAKKNAKLNKVNKSIKFLHGNLLNPFLNNLQAPNCKLQTISLLILANLPYLSKEIYDTCADNVKKYEPKTALYSKNAGLSHYDKLLKQIKLLVTSYQLPVTALLEISPEQKKLLPSLIKKHFPKAKIKFIKDLSKKWRVCKIEIG